jgi:cystathionine beta-lyase
MRYDFNSVVDRRNTDSLKWDFAEKLFCVEGILPMWVADMDFLSPAPVIEALRKRADHGIFGYSVLMPSCFEALKGWMRRRHDWDIEEEWVVFSPGVVPALHMLVRAFARPGDQVIVQTPAYPPFFRAIESNGCQVVDNPLRLDGEQYVMDLVDLERKLTPSTRMLIFCNPHNPVGRVWRQEEILELGKLCRRHDILIVSDEIHQDIVYDGFKHVPFTSVSPEFAEKTVVCTGASKTFNLPGLQMSNIIIPDAGLRERFCQVVKSCGISTPNTFGIVAVEAAYRYGEPWLEQVLDYLQENIEFLTEYVGERLPGLKVVQPQGTYLLWLDFRGLGIPQERLRDFVRQEARVALEPGSAFGCKEDGFERMNIACPRATLEEGLRRIEKAVLSAAGRGR